MSDLAEKLVRVRVFIDHAIQELPLNEPEPGSQDRRDVMDVHKHLGLAKARIATLLRK